MKARVKATGEIVGVYESYNVDFPWTDERGVKLWKTEELEFDIYPPNYWTRLEHTYAGMAMQGLCVNPDYRDKPWDRIAEDAIQAAHALVEKMKEVRK